MRWWIFAACVLAGVALAPTANAAPRDNEISEYAGPVLEMERFEFEIDRPAGFEVCGYPEGTSFTGFFFVTDKIIECEPNYRLRPGSISIHGNHNVAEPVVGLDGQVRRHCASRNQSTKSQIIGGFGRLAGERSVACQFVTTDGAIHLVVYWMSPPLQGEPFPTYVLRARILTDTERFNRDRATLRRVLRGFRWVNSGR